MCRCRRIGARHEGGEALLARTHDEFREPSGFVPMLATMGHHVEDRGLSDLRRRHVSRRTIDGDLPPLDGPACVHERDEPGTVQRCRVLREEIRRHLTRYGGHDGKPWMRNAVERLRDDMTFVEALGIEMAELDGRIPAAY